MKEKLMRHKDEWRVKVHRLYCKPPNKRPEVVSVLLHCCGKVGCQKGDRHRQSAQNKPPIGVTYQQQS
jgi:hypothetical protein